MIFNALSDSRAFLGACSLIESITGGWRTKTIPDGVRNAAVLLDGTAHLSVNCGKPGLVAKLNWCGLNARPRYEILFAVLTRFGVEYEGHSSYIS